MATADTTEAVRNRLSFLSKKTRWNARGTPNNAVKGQPGEFKKKVEKA